MACAWTLVVNLVGFGADQADAVATFAERADLSSTRGDKLAVALPQPSLAPRPSPAPQPSPAPNVFALLFDPHSALGDAAGGFVRAPAVAADVAPSRAQASASVTASLPPHAERVALIPAPTPVRAQPARSAPLRDVALANAPVKAPTIFEKLFGKPAAPVTLAYAAPDDAGLTAGASVAAGRYDRSTAVYDITAHVVYMPDGTRLEAHSGLGSLLDDPHHADARNRGVTPPALYDLQPREALFHGVRALRLIPQDENKVFGRSGLLAHSFMLGPNGDSNGCVSFRDYDVFLRAYENNKIKRLAVVTRAE